MLNPRTGQESEEEEEENGEHVDSMLQNLGIENDLHNKSAQVH